MRSMISWFERSDLPGLCDPHIIVRGRVALRVMWGPGFDPEISDFLKTAIGPTMLWE